MGLLDHDHDNPEFCRGTSITFLLVDGYEDIPAEYRSRANVVLADADGDLVETRIAQAIEDWTIAEGVPAVRVQIHTGARYADVLRLLTTIVTNLDAVLAHGERELAWFTFKWDVLRQALRDNAPEA